MNDHWCWMCDEAFIKRIERGEDEMIDRWIQRALTYRPPRRRANPKGPKEGK